MKLLHIFWVATCLAATSAFADTPQIVTWNINGGEQDKDILATNALEMMHDIGSFDVLVLQEVVSSRQVAEIADEIGFDHWAISDFSPPVETTGHWPKSLEVAIISRTPFEKIAEWDTSVDGYDPRASNEDWPTESLDLGLTINGSERPSRGFLRVDLADGLSVYAAHWKSSGGAKGDDDLSNAAKRENNARGLAADASAVLQSGRSVVIAGDFNIQPIGKHVRVGSNVAEDCKPSLNDCGAGGRDGYDDSMKILSEIGFGYRLLSAELPPTYLAGNFGPGAIDHIVVAGPLANSFPNAETVSVARNRYFGSDHSPVYAKKANQGVLNATSLDTLGRAGRDAEIQRLIGEVRERLELLEQLTRVSE
ncbi:endonuclease/exonuclease/phosphatase family protein [Roseibium sp. MMSF_3412]|uniref:endonuclease/exonuclease/phosphatase family protein n=1 Tax=Roseibium sp. MMSF_3412 TaxID=3046712 RepID=UPI00273E1D27|nr:endonuclease/exonuclease/phosphatase family protein [Roseibium sp. MMSF_3412]